MLPTLCQYLDFHYNRGANRVSIILIDGDQFEPVNRSRQLFSRLGPKATVARESMLKRFPQINFEAIDQYIAQTNVVTLIRDGDIVLLGVDNHATRMLVSNRCEDLDNITLISGGNELTDGNVQIFKRINGTNLTLPIANQFHPEIMFPTDKNPADLGCQMAAAAGDDQLVITNNLAAALMLAALYQCLVEKRLPPDEIYFDASSGNARGVHRTHAV